MTKAFAYLRVSGKGQIQGDGFPRQLEAIKHYAQAHGIHIVKVFRELGVTGTSDLENRPALMDMFASLTANGVKLVLIEKLDRLARDLMIQEQLIVDLRKREFDLISVMEPDLLQTDPSRVMMRQIFGSIAQYEKSMIVAKLRGARQRMKAKTGSCEGRKPYGFYDGESAILDRMKALRSEGKGFDRIAADLNASGLEPRSGDKWWGKTINNILSAA